MSFVLLAAIELKSDPRHVTQVPPSQAKAVLRRASQMGSREPPCSSPASRPLGELYSNCPPAAALFLGPPHQFYNTKMSARAFSLPIRAFSRPQVAQQAERYTCRRCLHTTQTQAQEATTPVQLDAEAPATSYNPALTFSQRDYSLSKTDRLVKRILPHSIRPQMLQHVDPMKLHGREREAALKQQHHKAIVGVVVRTGRMDKTVSVRVAGRRWEPKIGKVCLKLLRRCAVLLLICTAPQFLWHGLEKRNNANITLK